MNRNRRTREVFVDALLIITALLLSGKNSKADFVFGQPVELGPFVNTQYGDVAPSISTDGLSLYFCDFPFDVSPDGHGGQDLWVVTRTTIGAPWKQRMNLGPILNTAFHDGTPSISSDGLTLYFSSTRPEGEGSWDIWFATRLSKSDPWGAPKNLGPTVNSQYSETFPCISADGLELYFSEWEDPRPGGHGSLDIWVTKRNSKKAPWGLPINLGPMINSSSADITPCISPDGLRLFFYSARSGGHGASDIWVATRRTKDDPWGTLVNLGAPINTSSSDDCPSISNDGSILYFSSRRPGGQGGYDLWQASIEPIVDFNGDSKVDARDMSILVDHWHSSDPLCDIGPNPMGDGIVDFQDLKVLTEYIEPGFGRIAHWTLDETEGDIAYDSVGSDHANVHGEAVWQPDAGVLAGALEFDGEDDYVAPMTSLNPQGNPFRILTWVRGGAPGQVIASQTPDEFTPGGTYLKADPSDGTLVTELLLANMPLDSGIVVTDSEWHEVGIEWDGQRRHLLVNGEEVAVDEVPLPGLPVTGYLNIGTGPNNEPGSFWSGLLDDVRVYEKGG